MTDLRMVKFQILIADINDRIKKGNRTPIYKELILTKGEDCVYGSIRNESGGR